MKRLKIATLAVAGIVAAIYLANTSLLSSRPAGTPVLLAHRGLAQAFDRTGLDAETCTAARMLPPRHSYLENTIASMQAAFDLGADTIELDVHPTTDGQFAVFHDWTLECRTDGRGRTRDHDMAYLKTLDVGYGYTADGGKTFPFRGKGVGQMPALTEVLSTFPKRRFHINVKSNDRAEGEKLAAFLATLAPDDRSRMTVVGGNEPIDAVKQALPEMRVLSRRSLKRCVIAYAAAGWTSYVPAACRQTVLLVPINFAPWLWGWPDRFLDRMDEVDTRVFLLGAYRGGFSEGLDDPAIVDALPESYSGGISTDALDVIAPITQRRP